MSWQAVSDDTPRRLKVDLGEVAFAMENATYDFRHFLDLELGEVAFVSDEIRSELDAIDAEVYNDDGSVRVPFEDVLKQRNLPAWMEDAVREAAAVDEGVRDAVRRGSARRIARRLRGHGRLHRNRARRAAATSPVASDRVAALRGRRADRGVDR